MAIYELTNGDIMVTTPNCDCGLTGGCERCRPYIIPKHINCEDFIPLINEIWPAGKYRVFAGEVRRVLPDSPPYKET